MPFVDIDLIQGRSVEHLRAVSDAIRAALVHELGMNPDDNFQLFHQHEPGEMIFTETFRGGPRSADWMVLRISDDRRRNDATLRRFYRALVVRLGDDAGVRPEDVFVTFNVTAMESFSFASGIAGSESAAREALDHAATVPGTRDAYTQEEIVESIAALFADNDRTPLVSILPENFVMEIPTSLPYGGTFTGAQAFDEFFARVMDDSSYYSSFRMFLDHLAVTDDRVIAQIHVEATGATNGKQMKVSNAWAFTTADGNVVRAQLYADTAQGVKVAG